MFSLFPSSFPVSFVSLYRLDIVFVSVTDEDCVRLVDDMLNPRLLPSAFDEFDMDKQMCSIVVLIHDASDSSESQP